MAHNDRRFAEDSLYVFILLPEESEGVYEMGAYIGTEKAERIVYRELSNLTTVRLLW